jgi:hypothetical protein
MICSYDSFSYFKYRNSSVVLLCTFYSVIKYEIILGRNSTDKERIFILQTRLLKSWLTLDLDIYVEAYLRNYIP